MSVTSSDDVKLVDAPEPPARLPIDRGRLLREYAVVLLILALALPLIFVRVRTDVDGIRLLFQWDPGPGETSGRWHVPMIVIMSIVIGRFLRLARAAEWIRYYAAKLRHWRQENAWRMSEDAPPLSVTLPVLKQPVTIGRLADFPLAPAVIIALLLLISPVLAGIGVLALMLSSAGTGPLLEQLRQIFVVHLPHRAKHALETGAAERSGVQIILLLFAILPILQLSLDVMGRDRQVINVATFVMIYIMLGWGLNIVVGLAGMLDLGYVAFYAVGAYSFAIISKAIIEAGERFQDLVEAGTNVSFFAEWAIYFADHPGFLFFLLLPLAGLMAATFGMVLGYPVLRLHGDYLAIVTLAFGEIIRIVLNNWQELTEGPDGIRRIPRPAAIGPGEDGWFTYLEFNGEDRAVYLYYIILIMVFATNWVTMRLRRLPIGRAWEALREDEIACKALGINTRNVRLTAFALGAMFGGFAGAFFATSQGSITPKSFEFIESAIILAIVVLGGLGSQIGVVLAATLFISLSEIFREFDAYRMLLFGLAIIVVMVWRPRGLLSSREPTVRLHKREDRKPPDPEAAGARTKPGVVPILLTALVLLAFSLTETFAASESVQFLSLGVLIIAGMIWWPEKKLVEVKAKTEDAGAGQ